jgi:hypothetical protein
MAFKIKDLMINVAPSEGGANQGCCTYKSTIAYAYECPARFTKVFCSCGGRKTNPGWDTCHGHHTQQPPDPGEVLEELGALKAQLQAALAEVDADIQEIEETLRPKTVEEVEDLQTKLKGALEELDKIKADLTKE